MRAMLMLMLCACGSADDGSPDASLGAVDPALVGTWTGRIDGSLGIDSFQMGLAADATMFAEGTTPGSLYCRAGGTWGVTDAKFTARASDCTGTVIRMTASASSSQLSGSWTASSGRRGTFSVEKQP